MDKEQYPYIRAVGYYWVKIHPTWGWDIAEWDVRFFYPYRAECGQAFEEKDIYTIHETRIITPDEN